MSPVNNINCNCLALFALLLVTSGVVQAEEFTHVIRNGDTLSQIAKHYYGASWKSSYITCRNELDEKETPDEGRRIILPTSWIYTVRRGDSVGKIAKRFLGDIVRHKAIMAFNKLRNPYDLKVGAELIMPYHMRCLIQPGDTLHIIARRYYRQYAKIGAVVIKDYNKNQGELKPGRKLTIPIFDPMSLKLKEKGLPPIGNQTETNEDKPSGGSWLFGDNKESNKKPKKSDRLAIQRSYNIAVKNYENGDFHVACDSFEELLVEDLIEKEKARVMMYLGFCSIAFNDTDDALDYFQQWLRLQPDAKLDPITTSPKILMIFEEASSMAELNKD